jgi:DNA-binding LytR/AlgR family response regulator
MKIKSIIIEDEPLARSKLKAFINKTEEVELLEEFSNAIDGLKYLSNNKVDLLFLDIQMDMLSGIELLEIIENPPLVIFTTAYDEYAIKGYEFDVIDYLLKPYSFERFQSSISKVKKRLSETHTLSEAQIEKNKQIVFIKSGDTYERINMNDIIYIEGMRDYVRIHTDNKKIMVLTTFKALENKLSAPKFLRIHKSFMVALDKIDKVEYQHIKISGVSIPIGSTYRKAFYELLSRKEL